MGLFNKKELKRIEELEQLLKQSKKELSIEKEKKTKS